MTIHEWLKHAQIQLDDAGIGTARLDALVLLEDETGRNRSWLLAHGEEPLDEAQAAALEAKLKRRVEHEPLAYIREKSEFYGRDFTVNKHVLVPRPESETMIELFKKLPLNIPPVIADIGAGSGALGITAALERPQTAVHMHEIDPSALAVARYNAKRYTIPATFHEGDLLEANPVKYTVILANLPYVPDAHTINKAALLEPEIAIFGGPDGLDLYRRLFAQISAHGPQIPFILTESLPFQHKELASIATEAGYAQAAEDDFIQLFITAVG